MMSVRRGKNGGQSASQGERHCVQPLLPPAHLVQLIERLPHSFLHVSADAHIGDVVRHLNCRLKGLDAVFNRFVHPSLNKSVDLRLLLHFWRPDTDAEKNAELLVEEAE